MNLVSPFFGGMPMCHGAGGLAGQYYFGARTGGANIIEGTIEVGLGILLATSIANLFTLFPGPVIGSMMLLVGIQLVGFDRKPAFDRNLIPLAVTVAVSLLTNMAFGFLSGVIAHFGLKKLLGS
jgi:MFS superfamily sulfate permease-like transporter